MILLLVLWAAFGLMFFIIGVPILYKFKLHDCLPRVEDQLFVAIWLGIIVLSNLLLLASLFTPLTAYVAMAIVAVLAVPYFLKKPEPVIGSLSITRATGIGLAIVVLSLAFRTASATISFYDTGLYHYQLVKWLSEYGSVPGLALVHSRFGFTSSWFALAAPLQVGMFKSHLVAVMNGFIFCLMALQALVALSRAYDRSAKLNDWFFILAFVPILQWVPHGLIRSLSPDLAVILLIVVVVWLMITVTLNAPTTMRDRTTWPGAVVLILALGAVSIKLSVVPLLGVATLYYIFARGFSLRKVCVAAALAIPFIVTLMSVTTITSGCPLFPAPYFCTDLLWSVGNTSATAVSKTIVDWARWSGPTPADANSVNWLWLSWISKEKKVAEILAVNILCLAWLYFKRDKIGKELLLYTLLTALTGVIFTMVKGPTLRFGLGFLVVIPAFTVALFLLESSRVTSRLTFYLTKFKAPLLFLLTAYITVTLIKNTEYLRNYFLLPGEMKNGEVLYAQINNFKYSYPEKGDQCWAAKLPCAPGRIGGIDLRDKKVGLAAGFVKKL